MFKTCWLIFTVLVFCNYSIAHAQEYNDPGFVEFDNMKPYDHHEPPKDEFPPLDRTNIYSGWVIDVNLEKIKNKPVVSELMKKSLGLISTNFPIKFYEFPKEVSSIHIYGNGKKDKVSVLLRGEFNADFIDDYVHKFIQSNFKTYTLSLDKGRDFHKGKIFQASLMKIDKNGKKNKKRVYVGFIRNDLVVLSRSLRTVRSWFYFPEESWSFQNMNVDNENVFAQFLINVRPTLYHLKHNDNADERLYKSVLFQQTKNIHLTLSFLNENIVIGALFTAFDEEKAKNIYQIFEGILALGVAKNTKDVYRELYHNAVNIFDGKTVRIGTSLPMQTLKKINDRLVQ